MGLYNPVNISVTNEERYSNETNVIDFTASTTSQEFLDVNPARFKAIFYNNGANVLYLKLGEDASSTDYTVQLDPGGGYFDIDKYTGKISGVWAGGGGQLQVTELV